MTELPSFRLDAANQCLWRVAEGGREERILLAPKAFAVLKYLVDHAGRLVTHDELLDAVWAGSVVEPQAAKKHIVSLRTALRDHAKNSVFIETVRKRGYRFIGPLFEQTTTPAIAEPAVKNGLVGRGRELDELRDEWRRVVGGERRIVFVTGEPGIGKTALVEELQRQVASSAQPIRIARGQCVEGYGHKEAYGPMLDALGRLCRGPQAAPIVQILATQAPTWLAQFPALLTREHRETLQREILGATRERMLREFGDAIESITVVHPLLLVLEDVHWVDDSTISLISALARRQAPMKLMLLATCRPLDQEPQNCPLKSMLQDLLVHRLCRELALHPLQETEVQQYVENQVGSGRVPEGLAALLYRRSEGNPLFMVAALEHMTKQSLIAREKDGWVLKAPLAQIEFAVPDDLRRMIETQLERLSPREQTALELASVVGTIFSANLVSAAGDLDAQSLEDVYEELSRRQLIVRWTGTQRYPDGTDAERYEFVHVLYRQVLYDRLLPLRRAKLHRRIGERLEILYAQRLDEAVHEMAHHFEQAADWPRAIEYLQQEADIAQRRYAFAHANEILQRALQLLGHLPEAQRATQEIKLLQSQAVNYFALIDLRSIEACATLAARAAHHGRIDVQVEALIDLGYCSSWSHAQPSLEILRSAHDLSARLDPSARTRAQASCAFLRLWIGGWNAPDAQEHQRALTQLRESNQPIPPSFIIDAAFIQWVCANYREAHRLALEGDAKLFEQTCQDPYFQHAQAQDAAISSLIFLGHWGEALQELAVLIALMEKNGSYTQWFRILEAWVHLHALDFSGVLKICEAVAPAAPFSQITESRMARIFTGSAAVGLGDYERALEDLESVRRDMERHGVSLDWYWRMPLAQGLTELWLAKGDVARARLEAKKFLDEALASAERTWQGLAWEGNARVALASADLDRARDCIANALSTVQGFEVPLAAWRVHATAAHIDEQSGDAPSARAHRELARDTILQLANSMPAQEPLREIFLSSPIVAAIHHS